MKNFCFFCVNLGQNVLLPLPCNIRTKKGSYIMGRREYVLAKIYQERAFLEVSGKKNKIDIPKLLFLKLFWSIDFFCHDFHECHFVMKICKHRNILSKVTRKIQHFKKSFSFDFTVHRSSFELGSRRTL
ncbi:hypothetical protein VPH35_038295 [Triticum aestivum]|uniref:Uncharacterized protein n=1 Tax=Aegilops tauschii subsp. strangulata TaxID=200361 RepID=A0A453C9N3_AEGTS